MRTAGKTLAETMVQSPTPEVVAATAPISPKHGSDAHVTVSMDWLSKLPKLSDDDAYLLNKLAANGSVLPNSRLASQARRLTLSFQMYLHARSSTALNVRAKVSEKGRPGCADPAFPRALLHGVRLRAAPPHHDAVG